MIPRGEFRTIGDSVAERIGERLLERINHLGRDMLCYGIDREMYLTQVAPAGELAVCA